jgi:hypothetical protein
MTAVKRLHVAKNVPQVAEDNLHIAKSVLQATGYNLHDVKIFRRIAPGGLHATGDAPSPVPTGLRNGKQRPVTGGAINKCH